MHENLNAIAGVVFGFGAFLLDLDAPDFVEFMFMVVLIEFSSLNGCCITD